MDDSFREDVDSKSRSILVKNKFMYNLRNRTLMLFWFTNTAIYKFIQMIASCVLFVFTLLHPEDLSPGEQLVVSGCAAGGLVVCPILYLGHFLGQPAPRAVDLPLMTVAVVAHLVAACLVEHKELGTCFIVCTVAFLSQIIFSMACNDRKNCFYRKASEHKKKKHRSDTEGRHKLVRFSNHNVYVDPPDDLDVASLASYSSVCSQDDQNINPPTPPVQKYTQKV